MREATPFKEGGENNRSITNPPITVGRHGGMASLRWEATILSLFERIYNWGLFYAMGADERLLEMALEGCRGWWLR